LAVRVECHGASRRVFLVRVLKARAADQVLVVLVVVLHGFDAQKDRAEKHRGDKEQDQVITPLFLSAE
jgi:hypothetical protein